MFTWHILKALTCIAVRCSRLIIHYQTSHMTFVGWFFLKKQNKTNFHLKTFMNGLFVKKQQHNNNYDLFQVSKIVKN